MTETAKHTPTPWFVSGVRFRMDNRDWHSVNRYDEAKKREENIAIVGYDPRTGDGLADAHFIVRAVNSHADLLANARDLDRLCLVIESAVRQSDPPNREIVLALIKANRAAIARAQGKAGG